jgi:hypothetical protein
MGTLSPGPDDTRAQRIHGNGQSIWHVLVPGLLRNSLLCDGPFYKGVDELVGVGSGNTAAVEALYLTKFAKKVRMLVRAAIT